MRYGRSVSDWCDEEEPVSIGLIAELQRIRRRTVTRPWRVLLVALALTGAISYRIVTHKSAVEAEMVLALSQGSMAGKSTGLPVEELREYVTGVLMPDAKLAALIERRNMFHLRTKLGMEYAIEELRSAFEVEIWKNTFMTDDSDASHSARIGITVADVDPDKAYGLARDLAAIVIETATEQRADQTKKLAENINAMRERLEKRLADTEADITREEHEAEDARAAGHRQRAQALDLELAQLRQEQKTSNQTLGQIANSRDAAADQIAAAGLDVTVEIVDEHKPRESDHRSFVLTMAIAVIAFCAALGCALVLGAFDSRVHDTDDVERLGLTVLGHLPGFPGDQVGSLEARGVSRRRVPSFSRWRWLR
jgi:hypothetical protein